jgi:CheY-like chemotaxis protein
MNLVMNALEAIGERPGRIIISTSVIEVDAAYLADTRPHYDLQPGEYVVLDVTDDGRGMTHEILARVFDPFFTTKFTGRGLGLSAVMGIVRSHHGALKVQSEPGSGTSFKVLFPCAAEPVEENLPVEMSAEDDWSGTGTVLVVDDEEAIRATVASILELYGFTAEMAADGRTALEIFRAAAERFALVVLDLTMPGMDGAQLSSEIRRICPATPILLMSGFTENEVNCRFHGDRQPDFIQKPFTVRAFAEKVRESLCKEQRATSGRKAALVEA